MFMTVPHFPSYLFYHRLVMAKSSENYSDSKGELPQFPPRSDQMRLTGGGKSSKPPKAPKKKHESESDEHGQPWGGAGVTA